MSRPFDREFFVRTVWLTTDGLWWAVAILVTMLTRLNLDTNVLELSSTWLIALGAALIHGLLGLWIGPYLVRHIRGSFDEVISVARTACVTGLVLVAGAWLADSTVLPRSVPFLATTLAIVLMLAARFAVRSYRSKRAGAHSHEHRVIVYGAGVAGRRLVHNMLHDDRVELLPVAFVDDDRAKRRLKVEGIPVLGTSEDLVAVAEKRAATHLIIAIPTADSELIRRARELADEAGLVVQVLPPLNDWIRRNDPQAVDLRDLNLEDLLGRRAVQLDQGVIRDHLTGKVVLVTGAGGSIGSELCRQIVAFNPARLIMLDRDESALHAVQLSLSGTALLDGDDLILANIRDADTLREHFAEVKPDVVFHAAALKHLSLLERYPGEAWRTNVLGTLNVLEAAAAGGVSTFVNVSTDKAASPTSVLGRSKRIAERLTAHFARQEVGRYVSVRFGNVLGSRGSVIPAFTEQIRRGGPVTVTHPDVERYFGSGPFRLAEWIPGEHVVMEAVKDHWGPQPQVDRLILKIVPDRDECVRMVARGEAHIVPQDTLTRDRLHLLDGAKDVELMTREGPGMALLDFNHRQAPWTDERARRAIAHAVDREAIAAVGDPGVSQEWSHYLLGSTEWCFNPDAKAPGFDLAESARLLDEAGVGVDASGSRGPLRLYYMDMFHGHKPLAEILGKGLGDLGFQVSVEALSSPDWAQRVRTDGDFDLFIIGGSMAPDPEITSTKYSTGGMNNAAGHHNPDVDAAYQDAREALTLAERGEHYKRLQEVWARDTQWVPLFWYGMYYPRSEKFFGWSDQLGWSIPWWHWGRIRPVA